MSLFAHIEQRDFLVRQIRTIMDAICEEIEEDATFFDNPAACVWLINFGKMMEWAAKGDLSVLPEELRPVAAKIEDPQWAYRSNGQTSETVVTLDNAH